jgi:DNA polymerase I-like protein with 3'-5' exonuclease and polymerase domains
MGGDRTITNRAEIRYDLVTCQEQAEEMLCRIGEEYLDFITLDIETAGRNWLSPDGYVRTLQLSWGDSGTAVFRFMPPQMLLWRETRKVTDESGKVRKTEVPVFGFAEDAQEKCPCVPVDGFMDAFRKLLDALKPDITGHFLKYDGLWLLHRHRLDIRPYTRYDTGLAEHLIDNGSLLGLEALAMKYSDLGQYDGELNKWKKDNRECVSDDLGYACIPDEILLPYGAADVIATRMARKGQRKALERYLAPRHHGMYPSLFDSEMDTDTWDLYEMEGEGLTVDPARIEELTAKYSDMYARLMIAFKARIMERGFGSDFNIDSIEQVRDLLFSGVRTRQELDSKTGAVAKIRTTHGLGLTPIMTTKPKGGQQRKWEWVRRQSLEVQKHYAPSAAKQTLEILEDADGTGIVHALLDLRRVGVICKNFFRDDDEGGIKGNLWADGKLHPRFSQITATGRLRSEKPNVQNWSKQSERHLEAIFGKDKLPPSMRSVMVAPPGFVFVEGDLKQAELFVLAGLSDDPGMWADLNTPGKDLHTATMLSAFHIERLWPDMTAVNEEYVLDLAKRDLAMFEKMEPTFLYRDAKGGISSHDEVRAGIRTASKAVSFGIFYGRGATALHFQILAETGIDVPVEELQEAVRVWKEEKYPTAWQYLLKCQNAAVDPGYVENPWGRRRYFPKVEDESVIASNRREAANFPIQSTVGDCVRMACRNLRMIRSRYNLRFRLVNQIHDALLLLSPVEVVEETKEVLETALSSVEVPLPFGGELKLGAAIEVFARWGEKKKTA